MRTRRDRATRPIRTSVAAAVFAIDDVTIPVADAAPILIPQKEGAILDFINRPRA
jgi:hypothetical protein